LILLARTLTPQPTDLDQVGYAVLEMAWGVLGLVQFIVLGKLGEAVIVHAAFQGMQRLPVRLAGSLNVALRRFLPIVGVAFVVVLLIEFVVGVAFDVYFSIRYGFLENVGLILVIIPGLILYAMWFVAVPACVIERLGPWTSLRRSRQLTTGHRSKLFGLALLLIIPSGGVGFLICLWLHAVSDPAHAVIVRLIWDAIWGGLAAPVLVLTHP